MIFLNRLSIRTGTFFARSHLPIFQVMAFCNLWLDNVQLQFIQKQLRWAIQTVIDWASFCREVVFDIMINKREKIGGVGIEVQIDESKFGKRKYNRGHRVEG